MNQPAKDKFQDIPKARLNWQDVLAGISAAGLLLPQALAYAGIANLPAQAGIIGLFAGLLCYGLLGSSRFALVSPTSSSAVVLAAAALSMAGPDPAQRMIVGSGIVIMTGLVFLLAAAARLGNITNFIAKPVLRGFTLGLALIIIVKQLSSVLDVRAHTDNLFIFLYEIFTQFRSWNINCFIAAAAAIIFLLVMEWLRRTQKFFKNIPGGALAVIFGILAGRLLDLPSMGVPDIGSIDMSLNMPSLPDLSYSEWRRIIEIGLALVFILYAESYTSIRSFAMKHHDAVSPNRDLFALGICNIVSGIFQGLPVGAGYSATAANEACGAKTRLAGLFSLAVSLAVILTALTYIEWLPIPVLAALVIATMAVTLSPSGFSMYFKWRKDRLLFVISVLSVLALGVLTGLVIAIALSLAMFLRKNAIPTVAVLGRLGKSHDYVNMSVFPEAHHVPDILILRPDHHMFFANAEPILEEVHHLITASTRPVETVVLSLEQTASMDSTSLEALEDFFIRMQEEGIGLVLSRLKNPVYASLRFALGNRFPGVSFSRLSVAHAVRLAKGGKTYPAEKKEGKSGS